MSKPETCQFIIGEHGRRTIFCGQPARPRGSYCDEHHARVFMPATDYTTAARRDPDDPAVLAASGRAHVWARRSDADHDSE